MKFYACIRTLALVAMLTTLGLMAAEGGKGGKGGGGGGGGGNGGSGGSGQVFELPSVTDEQLVAFDKSLTPEQTALLDELMNLQLAAEARELKENASRYSKENAAALRASLADVPRYKKEFKTWLVVRKPEELKEFFTDYAPKQIERFHRGADPWYLSTAEQTAAQHLGPDAQKMADGLLSDDIESFIQAERKMLSYGPDCKALVAAAGRKAGNDAAKVKRIQSVLSNIEQMTQREQALRVVDKVQKRRAELEKSRGKGATGKLACMISRSFAFNSSDANGDMVYFSMPKETNGYYGAVSLQFDNGDGKFNVRMYGGQQNTIKDLGAVDYAGVQSAPNADETEQWDQAVACEIGHVYIEHCLEARDGIDATFKFRILDLKPREWVVIEYEKIPQKQ